MGLHDLGHNVCAPTAKVHGQALGSSRGDLNIAVATADGEAVARLREQLKVLGPLSNAVLHKLMATPKRGSSEGPY